MLRDLAGGGGVSLDRVNDLFRGRRVGSQEMQFICRARLQVATPGLSVLCYVTAKLDWRP